MSLTEQLVGDANEAGRVADRIGNAGREEVGIIPCLG
jgi:hypothetical protein